jgi:hypothetical protein
MQAFTTRGTFQSSLTFHPSVEKRGPRYIEVARLSGLRIALDLLRENLWQKLYIWRDAVCSFRGHIHTQSAKGRATVTFGPWFENHQGHLRRNKRTLARRLYTEKLLAIRPWVDSQDLQIFLMGFDAGEEWNARKETQV